MIECDHCLMSGPGPRVILPMFDTDETAIVVTTMLGSDVSASHQCPETLRRFDGLPPTRQLLRAAARHK